MAKWNDHRSRSPRGAKSQSISRAVVGFGRYPDKRPRGLVVDSSGAFQLSALMSAWGDRQGYTQQEVLDAIRENMFHEGTDRGGSLRFTIDAGDDGEITIRVNQRRGGAKSWNANDSQTRGSKDSAGAAGGADQEPAADKSWESSKASWDKSSEKWSDTKKEWDPPEKKPNRTEKEAESVPWWTTAPAEAAVADDAADRELGEKVQRWLGFVFKRGYEELDLHLKDGWAQLGDLAEVVSRKRRDFGITDAAGLRELLERTDDAGRFEIDEEAGLIRLLERAQRRHPKASNGKEQDRWRQRTEVKEELHPRQQRRWEVKEEAFAQVEPSASAASVAAAPGAVGRGPPAPGDMPKKHWQMFQDNGSVWFYYEGPLGKWWCQDKYELPEPFAEDD